MLDLTNIGKYKENNRIEAKKATGGLPYSLWETYSAFANTLGGVILLGVEEYEDKTLHPVDLLDTDWLLADFWETINDPEKVSLNILTDKDVQVHKIDKKHIIVINVPRAQRYDKPVYIEGDPLTGTYRRNGEGDYRCTSEEVRSMLRDAAYRTQDMRVLEHMGPEVFNYHSLRSYRTRMNYARPGHVWSELEDEEFLLRLGAAGRDEAGRLHPTAAGLLMFGYENEIVREFPFYVLDYQEQLDDSTDLTSRIVSSSGDWSGNVYDFYFRVYNRIVRGIRMPFLTEHSSHTEEPPVHTALREALANCLINADYYGKQGLLIIRKQNVITFSNPGGFRIDVEEAKSGGTSDPRNMTLIKMFSLIGIVERTGSGIPSIYYAWNQQGWQTPVITEYFEPERIMLSLPIGNDSDEKKVTDMQKEAIITYLTDHVTAGISEIAGLLGVDVSTVQLLLSQLMRDEIIVEEGADSDKHFQLKA